MNGTNSTTKLPFFDQVVVSPDFDTPILGSLYKASESYWSLNNEKAYVVSVFNQPHRIAVIDIEKKPSWVCTALKILACVTIVPLILLGIKAIVRFIHPIYVDQLATLDNPSKKSASLVQALRNNSDQRSLSPSQFTNVGSPAGPSSPATSSSSVSSSDTTDEYDATPSPSSSSASASGECSEENLALEEEEAEPSQPKVAEKSKKIVRYIDNLPVDDCFYVTLSTMPVHLTKILNDETRESLWAKAVQSEQENKLEDAMLYYLDFALISFEDDNWDDKGQMAAKKSIDLHVKYYKGDLLKTVDGDYRDKFFALIKLVRDSRECDAKSISESISKIPPLTTQPALSTNMVSLPENVKVNSNQMGPYTVSVHTRQNDRPAQEDTFLIKDFTIEQDGRDSVTAYLFGVFDGHGGVNSANYIRDHIIEELKQTFTYYSDLSDFSIFNTLKRACVVLNQKWLDASSFREQSGTTASMALIINNALWFINVGDSRGIFVKGNTVIQSSVDAKPTDPNFMNGILKRGGYLSKNLGWRLGGTLATARAFGDKGADGITARPKVLKQDLKNLNPEENNFLVIASDGLWDVFGSQQAADTIKQEIPGLNRKPTVEELAFYLTEIGAIHSKRDNCTTITVNLTPKPTPKIAEEKTAEVKTEVIS